ncbi:hypothetical protein Plec18167_001752 [Paecilomyces lecythidis]|uniref:Uncharacterized protein n=1 Tax=Paecilomyces lecythidis TaxID=3004212 RepID=A0ABR3YAS4_9EURO
MDQLVRMMANKVLRIHSILFRQQIVGIIGPKRKVIFETSPDCIKFDLEFGSSHGHYVVKFWAENFANPCQFCDARHEGADSVCTLSNQVVDVGTDLEFYGARTGAPGQIQSTVY